MSQSEETYSLPSLSESTPEQQEAIYHVLREVASLDFEIVGVDTARRIVRGARFRSVEGGRHLDLVESISVLSGIATLAHMFLATRTWIRRQVDRAKAEREKEWESLFGPLREKAEQDNVLADLLAQNHDLLREIAMAIDSFYEKEV